MKYYGYLVVISLLVLCSGLLFGQGTITSNGTGGGVWNNTGTWTGGQVPGDADSVVIMGTDSVYFPTATGLRDSCRSLTVLSGGIMSMLSTADTLGVKNTLTLQANAWFYDSTYTGRLPGHSYNINEASTVVFGTSSIGADTSGEQEACLEFGNVIVHRGAGSTAGGELLIHGDLTINNATSANVLKGTDSSSLGIRRHHVEGNVYIYRGVLSCVDKADDQTICIWDIDGNVSLVSTLPDDARIGPFSSVYARGLGIFNIHGNLSFVKSRMQGSSSSSHAFGTAIFNLGGDFLMDGGSHVTSNMTGPMAINFIGTHPQTVRLDTNFTLRAKLSDTVKAGSHVIFDMGNHVFNCLDTLNAPPPYGGNFVVDGTLEMKDSSRIKGIATFSLNPGATLIVGMNDGIKALPDSTNGNIELTGSRTFSPLANYVYRSGVAQSTGDGLPSSVQHLTIDNPNDVKLTAPVTVNDTLSVLNGMLKTDSNYVTLGASAYLNETPGNTVHGTVIATRTLAATSSNTFGNIGASITTSTHAPGSTTVTRVTGNSPVGNSVSAISRYFNIVPTVNTGLNAVLQFTYNPAELNGQDSSQMQLWQSRDTGSTWLLYPSNAAGYSLTASGINSFARWTASDLNHPLETQSHQIFVNAKWNMVSLPYNVPDRRKSILFPHAQTSAYAYSGGYVTKDTLKPMVGYWLKFQTKDSATVTGGSRISDSAIVAAGWNLIGTVSSPMRTVNIIQSDTALIKSLFYGYEGQYFAKDTLRPGKGYWVKCRTTGKLYFNAANPLAKQSPAQPAAGMLNQLNSITVTDNEGNHQTLYFGKTDKAAIDPEYFEMPPTGPEGSFDARFTSNRSVELVDGQSDKAQRYGIAIQASAYPLTVSWNITGDASQTYTLGDASGRKQVISGSGSTIVNAATKQLFIEAGAFAAKPTQFSLSNNYPNPFNPSTSFVIGVPQTAHVQVAVYDVLGRNVRMLLNSEQSAGFHTVEWNGLLENNTAAPSGIYFVKMVSDRFNAVQKIMMMK